MFRAESWAEAFTASAEKTGADGEKALEYLKVFCRAALSAPGDLSGLNDAERLGTFIDAALDKTGLAGGDTRLALRFTLLMIRKNVFRRYRAVIRGIEKNINRKKGLVELVCETASPPEEKLLSLVREKALALTGAREIKTENRVIPELIGGIRLRIGSRLFDGSLKTRLRLMASELGKVRNGTEA
jgi:F-type H+-transporting ATPase subunit delta